MNGINNIIIYFVYKLLNMILNKTFLYEFFINVLYPISKWILLNGPSFLISYQVMIFIILIFLVIKYQYLFICLNKQEFILTIECLQFILYIFSLVKKNIYFKVVDMKLKFSQIYLQLVNIKWIEVKEMLSLLVNIENLQNDQVRKKLVYSWIMLIMFILLKFFNLI